VTQAPSFSSLGHFTSILQEFTQSGAVNLAIPFQIGQQNQTLKVGGYYQGKDRDFDARIFGYRSSVQFFSDPEFTSIVTSPLDEVFVDENLVPNRLYIDEITNASDSYIGDSRLIAAYGMFDNKIGKKLRIVWGARMEQFTQNIETADFTAGGNEGQERINNDTTYLDILPSVNVTYAVSDKINIRLSGSQTVARPEFRERALFNYYNFQNFTNISGNLDLVPTDIYNADIRFEYYPSGGQIVSVSAFYKYFNNPISYLRIPGEGGGGIGTQEAPINEDNARNIGIETEIRKNFDFIGIEQLVFSTNLAYINSVAKLDTGLISAQVGSTERGLYYQSPWIVNLGLTWLDNDGRFDATVLFNTYGSRRIRLGNAQYPDIFEAPQNRLDAQIGVRLVEGLKLKITGENLLRAPIIQYWDIGNGTAADPENNGRYDEELDPLISRFNTGAGISVSLSWRIN
jgi:TonB-dependent receptor